MALAIGDVWAFSLEQSLFGQQIINTFALRITAVPVGTAEGFFLGERFGDPATGFNGQNDILEDFKNLQTGQVAYRKWNVRRVQGVLSNVFEFPLQGGTVGSKPGDCETANIALSLQRKGILAGRRSRGRIAVAGLPTTSMAEGKWNEEVLISATALAGDILGVKTNAQGVTFEMGFWSPGGTKEVNGQTVITLPLFTPVVSAVPQPTVRVQRSRTLGVGS
jgi:hypothetical protein